MREMRSALASRIYKNGVKQSASGAVSPDPQWSIPMFRANFLCFASKIVEPSRYLPVCSALVNSDGQRATVCASSHRKRDYRGSAKSQMEEVLAPPLCYNTHICYSHSRS